MRLACISELQFSTLIDPPDKPAAAAAAAASAAVATGQRHCEAMGTEEYTATTQSSQTRNKEVASPDVCMSRLKRRSNSTCF